MNHSYARTAIVSLIFALQGCVAVGPRFAPQPLPDTESTVLYVYRPAEMTNFAITPELYVDNVRVGELTNGGYVVVTAKKGEHQIRLALHGWKGAAVSVADAAGGDQFYFRAFTSIDMENHRTAARSLSLRQVGADEARSEIADTRKIAEVDRRR